MVKLFDRVKVNIATTGTGDVTFGAASSNAFLTPTEAGCVDTDTVRYVIVDGTDYEEGIGTITSSAAEMERTTVTRSKIGGVVGTSKISLSGTAVLAFTVAAADLADLASGGDMLSTNNLSDVANSDTALDNLGGTTVGKAVFKAADESAAREVLRIQRKNYVINGAMMVSQENGSSAGTVNGYYLVDLFRYFGAHDGAISVAQVASVTPAGSPNRIRITVTTADTSIGATQFAAIVHSIEGYRVADLMFGSVDARGLVLRFGVKAPAGTYCVGFRNGSNDRSYVAEFTIAGGEANTDVVKEIAIPGCDNGAWNIANGVGLQLSWGLAIGSTYQGSADTWLTSNFIGTSSISNFLDTIGNVFELFDVGLYEGTVAPDFVVPDLYQELHHCKRYFETNIYGGTFMQGSSFINLYLPLSWQEKRATPTLTLMTSLTNLCYTPPGGGLTPSGFSYNSVSSTAGRAQITSSGSAGVTTMLTKVDARL